MQNRTLIQGRDGAEKGRTLGEMREERTEQQEERDNHKQDEWAVEGTARCHFSQVICC